MNLSFDYALGSDQRIPCNSLCSALSPEEKAHLRARLVSAIAELEDRQV